jgi:hypothetical protein
MKTGIELIAEERARQISEEGWTAEHDEIHDRGEIPAAAACYALNASGFLSPLEMRSWHKKFAPGVKVKLWPWGLDWWKPTTPIRDLVKAGALIAAEIDRLQNEAAQDS